jgi:hypothetical protein
MGILSIRAGAPAIPFSECAHRVAAALPRITHAQRFDFAECAFLAVITLLILADLFVISAAVIVAARHTVFRVIALASTAALWWYLLSNLFDLA